MTTVDTSALLQEIKEMQRQSVELLKMAINMLGPKSDPLAGFGPSKKIKVVVEQAYSYCIQSWGVDQKTGDAIPVMAVYPRNTAAAHEHIGFIKDSVLRTSTDIFKAGGQEYYRLIDFEDYDRPSLYLRKGDVEEV